MKKLLYLYPYDFEEVFLEKDVGLIPKYLSKIFNLEIDFAIFDDYKIKNKMVKYFEKDNKINILVFERIFNIKNKKILKILFPLDHFRLFKYILKNVKNYEFVMIFHFSLISWIYLLFCKIINNDIKVILKLDIDRANSIRISNIEVNLLKKIMKKSIINITNLITCETMETYHILTKSSLFPKDKITYLPNGLDENLLKLYKSQDLIDNKENIILTVGRLGEYQKNTEMLLEAIRKIDLKDWKIFLIGTMTKEFSLFKDSYLNENPCMRDKVIFVGPIYNRDKLFEFFAKSKGFVLTSRFESYALVLNEAYAYLNFIISTKVGAANDIIESQKNGILIEHNSNSLTMALEEFIENENFYSKKVHENNRELLGWCNIIERNLDLKKLFTGNK